MLLNRALDDDSDTEWENPETIDSRATPRPESTTAEMVDEYPEISGITNAREAMKNMAEEDKAVIAEQVESFRTEKRMFDQEVSKWDDQGNDIIVLAKHMCMIMMEMTDFTRGMKNLLFTVGIFEWVSFRGGEI